MLLQPGHWLGRGSLIVEGASLGERAECEVRVEQDDSGITLTGALNLQSSPSQTLSVRVAPDEVGTYVIDALVGDVRVDGVAKLESTPNLGLLWNARDTLHVACTLFAAREGYGFRGFLRERDHTLTWELAFSLKQDAVKASNVVRLHRRR